MSACNTGEHHHSRRDLFRYTAGLGLAGLMPWQLHAADGAALPSDRFLVLIELDGGNDGLNTLVPVEDDRYYQYRDAKGLAIPQSAALTITGTSTYRLHPSLTHTRSLYDNGECSLIAGIGSENNNRSHFRGIDIWNTGSDQDEVLTTGWLGRIMAGTDGRSAWTAESTNLKRYQSSPTVHPDTRNLTMVAPDNFIELGQALIDLDPATLSAAESSGNLALQKIVGLHQQAQAATSAFGDRLTANDGTYAPPSYSTPFPDTTLGNQMKGIADVIASGTAVPVHKASLRTFDHHAAQVDANDPTSGNHAAQLAQVDGAIGAFRDAMVQHGLWDRVLVMTYSEFGRRVFPNDSFGTDHGGASVQMAYGGKVAGGIIGAYPSLAREDLHLGDLVATTDFRRAYVSAADFLGLDHSLAFGSSHGFTALPLIA